MAFRLWCALALSAICLMVVVGTAQADGDGRADLRGTWRGAITGAAPRITVQLRMGAVDRIRFRGGIRCAGVLEYLGRRGAAFRYRERITTSSSATCVRLGIVHLTPRADGSLRYTWRAGQERARAILRRP
jgi:hypothetical protein